MAAVPAQLQRARRWFWSLLAVAVLAMGALYRAIDMPAGPGAATTVLLSGLVLVLSTAQASRILRVLRGPARLLSRRPPHLGG